MIHLWATAGSGRYPVCGASTPGKGDVATSYTPSELCPACRAFQARKSARIMDNIRKRRGQA